MKTMIGNFLINHRLVFAAFFLPVLIMVSVFAATGIYPFGENQIAIIDMYHQYLPFLSELQYKLQHAGSLFYTWNGAGGSNFWCLLAYYGASPLNLLLALFPARLIMEAVTLILLIKVGLCGSFMFIYLSETQGRLRARHGAPGWQAVGFSCLYALNSYVMGYFWCIMWMDAVMLLPLCILGLCRLIDERKVLLYTVSLALIVFCNYYIAIMVCIFILLYYPVLYFIRVKNGGRMKCLRTTLTAAGHSLLAIAMAAVMLLPAYISMQNTYYIKSKMPSDWTFRSDPLDILNQLLPGGHLTNLEGLPNIYCGLITVMLLIFFLMNGRIAFREKILNGAFLAFMFLSLNVNGLDFIWHGFHFPNQLPYRYSFVICFVLVGMACKSLSRIDGISVRSIYAVMAGGSLYYLIAQKLLRSVVDNANVFFYMGLALLLVYGTILAVYRKGRLDIRYSTLLLTAVITAEMLCNTGISLDKAGNTSRSTYRENAATVEKLVNYVNGEDFARTEMGDPFILNCPALYHYKGVSQFSSSLNSKATYLMERIGLEGEPGKNRYNYNLTDPVTNAMLNIKYLIAKNEEVEDEDFRLIKRRGYSKLYESRRPLSIGYMAPDSMRTWDVHSDDPFTNLNDYVRAVTDNEYSGVFKDKGNPEVFARGLSCKREGDGIFAAEFDGPSSEGRVKLRYRADEGTRYYVYVEADGAEEIEVKRGNPHKNIYIQSDCGSIVNIGRVEEGESFDVDIDYKGGNCGMIRSRVCTLDSDIWERAYALMSRDMLKVRDFSDASVRGTVLADGDGLMVTSIPYEKGWRLKVDGKEKTISELTGGVWISTALNGGSHDIELKFRPPGIVAGFLISLLSLILLIVLQKIYDSAIVPSRWR